MGAFVDRTGEIHGGMQIVQELGNKRVMAQCLACGKLKEYDKRNILQNKTMSCGCINAKFVDRTGQTFNKLTILKELGNGEVLCKCSSCGKEKVCNKTLVTTGRVKTCGCGIKTLTLKDKTGEKYNNFEIIKELGAGDITAKCLICGYQDQYEKYPLVNAKVLCKKCKSGGSGSRLDDLTGNVYGQLKVTKELGKNKIECSCTICGHTDTYVKHYIKESKTSCKKCGNRISNRVGQIFRDLEIIKELGGGEVECKCKKCNHTDIYTKHTVVKSGVACKKCGTDKRFVDRTGEIYGKFKIEKELGGSKVICKCLNCGNTEEFYKPSVIRLKVLCKYCGVKLINDTTGQIFNELRVIKELGEGIVQCECIKCGKQDKYRKASVINEAVNCNNCGITFKYQGKIINNVTIKDFAYTGRNANKYYNCKCNKCGEELILTREEIVNYTCTKE